MAVPQPLHPLPSRVCGPIGGLCGFSVALVSGMVASADANTVLIRAIVSCMCCTFLGYVAGYVLEFVASRVIERERRLLEAKRSEAAGQGKTDAVVE